MAKHAHSLVEGLDMSSKEYLHEYVAIKGSGMGQTIQTVQVR